MSEGTTEDRHADVIGARTREFEAVARVRAAGKSVLFLTNGTGKPPTVYAADIRSVGFELDDDEFMNPAVVAARWIARKHPGKNVLVLKMAGVVAPLHDLGIETVDSAAGVVLVGWDDVGRRADVRSAALRVRVGLGRGTALCDLARLGVLGRRRPRSGLVGRGRSGDHADDGRQAVAPGKPSPVALREMCRALGTTARRTLIVGDDLKLEIAMARRGSARAALVLTGISTRAEARQLPHARRSDHVLRSVAELR